MTFERKLQQLITGALLILLTLALGVASMNLMIRVRRINQQRQEQTTRQIRRIDSEQPDDPEVEVVAEEPFSFFNDGVPAR